MLRALASSVKAVLSEVIVIGVVVVAVVFIAREGRGSGGPALEVGDVATSLLGSEQPRCSDQTEAQLEPPVIEIPADYEAKRIYRTPDLDRQAPRGRLAWTGDWL
jgi:hypothetical protein